MARALLEKKNEGITFYHAYYAKSRGSVVRDWMKVLDNGNQFQIRDENGGCITLPMMPEKTSWILIDEETVLDYIRQYMIDFGKNGIYLLVTKTLK